MRSSSTKNFCRCTICVWYPSQNLPRGEAVSKWTKRHPILDFALDRSAWTNKFSCFVLTYSFSPKKKQKRGTKWTFPYEKHFLLTDHKYFPACPCSSRFICLIDRSAAQVLSIQHCRQISESVCPADAFHDNYRSFGGNFTRLPLWNQDIEIGVRFVDGANRLNNFGEMSSWNFVFERFFTFVR